MMDATVAVIQMDCVRFDKRLNLAEIERRTIEAVREYGANLVVAPELATTGYFVGNRVSELAEPSDGPTLSQLASLSARLKCHLAVGYIEADDDGEFNSLALLGPRGDLLANYRKVHLFASERASFREGSRPVVVDTELGPVGLSVCYDLLMPEFVRGLALMGAKLVVNATNWITDPWQSCLGWTGEAVRALCRTRALENGVHVAMAARVGQEDGFTSVGHSMIASPTGQVLKALEAEPAVTAARVTDPTLDLERWRAFASYIADRRPEIYARMGVDSL